jgi:hypothetical protein
MDFAQGKKTSEKMPVTMGMHQQTTRMKKKRDGVDLFCFFLPTSCVSTVSTARRRSKPGVEALFMQQHLQEEDKKKYPHYLLPLGATDVTIIRTILLHPDPLSQSILATHPSETNANPN